MRNRTTRWIFFMALIAFLACCAEQDRVPPPTPEMPVFEWNLALEPSDNWYLIDVDSNQRIDYKLSVTEKETSGSYKSILRLEGEIFGIYTSSIYAPLRMLSDAEQCNVFYSSILEAASFTPGTEMGPSLDTDWRFTGDFHHEQSCFGSGCPCPVPASDIRYVPIAPGTSGFIALRFIIRNRKHFAWMQIDRSVSGDYTLRRISYNRNPETAVIVPSF